MDLVFNKFLRYGRRNGLKTVLRRNPTLLVFLGCLILSGALGSLHFLENAGGTILSLSILSPHGDNIRQEVGAGFQSWYRDRYGDAPPQINWIDQGGTSEDLRYVLGRFAKTPASIGIDLFFGGGTPPFRTLAKEGLLEPGALDRSVSEAVPEAMGGVRLRSDSEGWYGVALSGFGILFNRTLLREKGLRFPTSWKDLGEPEADGWVASVDPRGSGSAHVIYEIILQKFGWEEGWGILTRIAANSGHFTKGASAVLPLVSAGDAAYTVAIDQYAWSLIETLGGDRVGFLLPAGETIISPDPVAMLKGAPQPRAAARFMEYLLSDSCQYLWSLKAGEPGGPAKQSLNRMSIVPRVAARIDSTRSFVRGDPFAEAAVLDWSYSDSLTESRWSLLNDALGLWMVDNHDGARAAWRAINARTPKKTQPREWAESVKGSRYFRPPASWPEMQRLSEKWKDETFRNGTMARWARELHD